MQCLIALLTDFGQRDWYVAAMKGVIKRICADAEPVDISHEVQPQSVVEGAFVLDAAHEWFPPGTIFVAVVDPGVGTLRQPVLMSAGTHWFIAPNNGLLGYIAERYDNPVCRLLDQSQFFLPQVSVTFHGRDVFAPCAAHLARGVPADELAPNIVEPVGIPVPAVIADKDGLRGSIVYFDRFGNAITNIRFKPKIANAHRVTINELRITLTRTYAEVPLREPLAYWGSNGRLEIAVNHGNAREQLNLVLLQAVTLEFE
jgi:S-adenosylmethionine hydrolase